MKRFESLYKRHRFPPEIIQQTVWLYYRFNLSSRDIEDLLAERGIAVSYEWIRLWCIKFGSKYAKRLRRRHQGYGDTFFIDKVFVKIQGKQHYLWRAVDQDGEEVNMFLQARRDGKAATCFFKRLLKTHGGEPRKMVIDKLGSYDVAHREPLLDTIHDMSRHANNRAELLHQPTRGGRGFASIRVSASDPALFECTCGCVQSIQLGPAFDFGQTLPIVQTARLYVLGICCSTLIRIFPGVGAGLTHKLVSTINRYRYDRPMVRRQRAGIIPLPIEISGVRSSNTPGPSVTDYQLLCRRPHYFIACVRLS